MNRAKLALLLSLVGTALVGGVTFSIYAPDQSTTAADLADAGIAGPNRVATCACRIAPACAAAFGVKTYETLRMPVFLSALDVDRRDVVLPPRIRLLGDCVRVLNWAECDLDPVATFPGVAAKWGDNIPVSLARAATRHVIPDCRVDGGWDDQLGRDGGAVPDCRSIGFDGGPQWIGCNVMLRSSAVGAACLNAPSGVVSVGERVEDSL